jgi:two-component system chemotaxis sensor kinase CheA
MQPMDERNDLVKEFLVESRDNLDRLDQDLVDLEKDPQDRVRLSSIFRTIHTIKGTCGFLGFTRLEAITHVGENLLSRLRELELRLDADMTSGLLAMVDAVRMVLASIEHTGMEGEAEHSDLIARLNGLNQSRSGNELAGGPSRSLAAASVVQLPMTAAPSSAATDDEPSRRGDERRGDDDRRSWDERRHGVSDSSLRVDVGLLDKLMDLVGELVLARNQILQFTATQTHSTFVSATGRLNLVTSELQEGVMKTRMQPIGNIWRKFPRMVRDLAAACGKQVRIEMEGKDTDLDKTIIEAIKDPLTHIVRNSVDHGIEPPAVRLGKGKPAEGRLHLRAFHQGGHINIEISDDGAGIDPARVRDKALQRGLISGERARGSSDHELTRLVFLPGISTAETVTTVSGRGVGMDVVKTNIERIGGQIDIHSVRDAGTTLTIKIPLTLAIIPALIVATGGERYAIPQVSLIELVHLDAEQTRSEIEEIDGARFHRLRGHLLPLLHLQHELGGDRPVDDVTNIVVLKVSDRQFGLAVEEIHDTEEIVVKPLSIQLKGIDAFAGATIMGDGKVALILDVLGIAQRANIVADTREQARAGATHAEGDGSADLQALLLFRVGDTGRMAIPLGLVARLEEFPSAAIERSGGHDVVQYRNAVMPLLRLAAYFGVPEPPGREVHQVIVFNHEGRNIGLVVDQILDIVSERVTMQRTSRREGVSGSVVLQQRVTDLLDVHAIVQGMAPSLSVAVAA